MLGFYYSHVVILAHHEVAAAAAVAAATPLSLIKPDRETGDYGIFATRNKGGNLGVVSRFEDLTLFASYRYQVSGLGISCKILNRKKTRIFQRVVEKPESSKGRLMSEIARIFTKIRDDETRTISSVLPQALLGEYAPHPGLRCT